MPTNLCESISSHAWKIEVRTLKGQQLNLCFIEFLLKESNFLSIYERMSEKKL